MLSLAVDSGAKAKAKEKAKDKTKEEEKVQEVDLNPTQGDLRHPCRRWPGRASRRAATRTTQTQHWPPAVAVVWHRVPLALGKSQRLPRQQLHQHRPLHLRRQQATERQLQTQRPSPQQAKQHRRRRKAKQHNEKQSLSQDLLCTSTVSSRRPT